MIALGPLADIAEGGCASYLVGDCAYFVVQRDGQYFGYVNRCPHLGIPLDWQPGQFLDAEGELIQCATHGALFVIETGLCVAGPCTGDHLQQISLQVQGNTLYLVSD